MASGWASSCLKYDKEFRQVKASNTKGFDDFTVGDINQHILIIRLISNNLSKYVLVNAIAFCK